MITALRHKFTKDEYTMRIEAMKDGYRSQISSGFGLVNPRVQAPDGLGTVSTTAEEPNFERASRGGGL